ncbi:Glycoside hydrolase, family 28 [Dillenia turbinata]|uniref:Glycoside hydrolase, family 28 n=1 Tax=Dillenia turbinata TaxID=194707 RepID=A0AAN8YYP1_9MAGN
MGCKPIPLAISMLLLLIVSTFQVHAKTKDFILTKYGARADGKTDNSKVFLKVWNEACKRKGRNAIIIPPGVYMTNPVCFKGPCGGEMIFNNKGVVKAPSNPQLQVREWIAFKNIDRLTVFGDGTFDGQGHTAWPYKKKNKGLTLPIILMFNSISNSVIHHIKLIDSKSVHMKFFSCSNIHVDHVTVSAPGDSPNTDGIIVSRSHHIDISNSNIGSGDDCIALLSGSKNVNISHVNCGPGHGISVGSMGGREGEKDIRGLLIQNCTFTNTTNGVRIKTKVNPSFPITASNIVFRDIIMSDVSNPIIIDQQYVNMMPGVHSLSIPYRKPEAESQVQVADIKYINIRGSSKKQVAVKFLCSKIKPCKKLNLKNINLKYDGQKGPAKSECVNANGVALGKQNPPSCL